MTSAMIFGLLGMILISTAVFIIVLCLFASGSSHYTSGKSSLEMQLHQQHLEEKMYHEAMMQSMRDNMYRDEMAVHNTSHDIGNAIKDIGNMVNDLSR